MAKRAKTKSNATPGELRRALENLLADVTAGNLQGRNPWSLDSVKAASFALTGETYGFTPAQLRSPEMFVIYAGGKKYRFKTLDAAKLAANDIFQRRGDIVGIVKES